MARLPQPGGDAGNWGAILNDYLAQSHSTNGSLKPGSVGADQLREDSVTAAHIVNGSILKSRLADAVQVSLEKADSAYQRPAGGVPLTDLDRADLDAAYAPIVETAVLTRDSSGRIMSAVENGVTVTYTRDSQGRIESETRNGKTTTYTRDSAGRVNGWSTV